jgi:hypothetical protein
LGVLESCGPKKLHPVENLSHVTLLHQFQPGVPGRWKSIDSKCVRAARSFDEAQGRSNLKNLDFSLLLPDVMTIADEVHAQLTQTHAQVDSRLVFALSSRI